MIDNYVLKMQCGARLHRLHTLMGLRCNRGPLCYTHTFTPSEYTTISCREELSDLFLRDDILVNFYNMLKAHAYPITPSIIPRSRHLLLYACTAGAIYHSAKSLIYSVGLSALYYYDDGQIGCLASSIFILECTMDLSWLPYLVRCGSDFKATVTFLIVLYPREFSHDVASWVSNTSIRKNAQKWRHLSSPTTRD